MDLFKRILHKIKRYIFYKVLKFVTQQKGKKFEKFFNLYSKFDNFVKIKVQFSDPDYFILDNNKKYKFFPLERIRFYLQGLNTRFEILKKEYLLDNIKFNKDDVVIDCGANNGDFYFCFNDKIRYYGFEPSPIVFKNLKHNTIDGSFREDLFHRLNVIYFYLPPLIERSTDIPLLINYFFKRFKGENYEYKNKIKNIDLFYDYNWPGNIRELRNLVERIVILSQDDVDKIEKLVYNYFNSNLKVDKINSSKSDLTLKEARDNFEREYLIKQLKINDGNVSKTAKSVGMERSALHRKLSLLNIKY